MEYKNHLCGIQCNQFEGCPKYTPQPQEESWITEFRKFYNATPAYKTISEFEAFIHKTREEAKEELLKELLLLAQEDIDWGAKHQQMTLGKVKSRILVLLKLNKSKS